MDTNTSKTELRDVITGATVGKDGVREMTVRLPNGNAIYVSVHEKKGNSTVGAAVTPETASRIEKALLGVAVSSQPAKAA